MTNNLNQYPIPEDEIDLRELIKVLVKSKKLIILTILIFTIVSIIYSLSLKPEFKSSSIIEIGYYEMTDGTVELIEKPSDTISAIRTNLIYKKRDGFLLENLIIKSPENKLIELQLTSKSSKKNVDLLSEVTNFIDARHSGLLASSTNQQKNQLSYEIDLIDSEISFLKENIKLELEAEISKLQNNLPIIDQEISQLEQVVTQDTNNLNLLKGTTLAIERASNSPTLEQIISSYKSQINQLKRERSSSILDISILSQKLDGIHKDDFQSDELFSLEQKQKILENQLQTLSAQTIVKTGPIGNIQTNTIKPKILHTILLGLIIGFITSILLVFINNFYKKL